MEPGDITTIAAPSPTELTITSIGLDAAVRPEGLRNGVINPEPGTLMWFNGYGRVTPGDVGTAVIAGHVVSGDKADVFARLHEVTIGTIFSVGDPARVFRVSKAFVADKDALTTDADVWGENGTVRRVVLVTCDDGLGYRTDGHRVANYVVVGESS